MKTIRIAAITVLCLTALTILGANYLAPAGYERQFREMPQAAPSAHHPLGTDDVGRDRWARLLYGMRVSLTLAPLAALLTTVLAGLVGGIAGYFGGWTERCCKLLIDFFLSIPWLFLLITVRCGVAAQYFTGSFRHRHVRIAGTAGMGGFSTRDLYRRKRSDEV